MIEVTLCISIISIHTTVWCGGGEERGKKGKNYSKQAWSPLLDFYSLTFERNI